MSTTSLTPPVSPTNQSPLSSAGLHEAVVGYVPEQDGEIALAVGDLIASVKDLGNGWSLVKNVTSDNIIGIVPTTCIQPMITFPPLSGDVASGHFHVQSGGDRMGIEDTDGEHFSIGGQVMCNECVRITGSLLPGKICHASVECHNGDCLERFKEEERCDDAVNGCQHKRCLGAKSDSFQSPNCDEFLCNEHGDENLARDGMAARAGLTQNNKIIWSGLMSDGDIPLAPPSHVLCTGHSSLYVTPADQQKQTAKGFLYELSPSAGCVPANAPPRALGDGSQPVLSHAASCAAAWGSRQLADCGPWGSKKPRMIVKPNRDKTFTRTDERFSNEYESNDTLQLRGCEYRFRSADLSGSQTMAAHPQPPCDLLQRSSSARRTTRKGHSRPCEHNGATNEFDRTLQGNSLKQLAQLSETVDRYSIDEGDGAGEELKNLVGIDSEHHNVERKTCMISLGSNKLNDDDGGGGLQYYYKDYRSVDMQQLGQHECGAGVGGTENGKRGNGGYDIVGQNDDEESGAGVLVSSTRRLRRPRSTRSHRLPSLFSSFILVLYHTCTVRSLH